MSETGMESQHHRQEDPAEGGIIDTPTPPGQRGDPGVDPDLIGAEQIEQDEDTPEQDDDEDEPAGPAPI